MAEDPPRDGNQDALRDPLIDSYLSSYPLRVFKQDGIPTNDSHDLDRHGFGILYPNERHDASARSRRAPPPALRFLPGPLRPWFQRVILWVEGPSHPRPFHIRGFFESIQKAPAAFLTRRGQRPRFWFLLILCCLCAATFSTMLYFSAFGCEIVGYGQPKRLSCISRFWPSSKICGVDGDRCRPFHNETFAFRCPANCEGTKIWNPRFIGNEEINYRPLVVGGLRAESDAHAFYRGDSFICGAARHSGLISNQYGGVGVVSLTGERTNFPAVDANGISSVGFQPSFPQSFTFQEPSDAVGKIEGLCRDPRWTILAMMVFFTSVISIFTTGAEFFYINFVAVFFTVALATNPPDFEDFHSVISSAFGRFLPAVFVSLVVYRYCIWRTLNGFGAQFEKIFLWLGACWFGALNNVTFDKLPLQRLTPHDLQNQPGAIPTLIVIIVVIFGIAFGQVWAFHVEGRLPRYLAFYAVIALGLVALIAIPSMKFRLHHYILALLLLPGTALQTRPSLVYQGLLMGLFINGVARWGFASILETPTSLIADGPVGSLVPQIAPPTISDDTITFTWVNLTQLSGAAGSLLVGFDSMSILINDVERFRGFEDHNPLSFTWKRHVPDEVEYIRVAFVKFGRVGKDIIFDYTKPGTWFGNGTWAHFES